MSITKLIRVAVLSLLAVSCHESRYIGDGQLRDAGITSGSQRFVLELGPIDLSHKVLRQYRLAGMPEESFTIGVDVAATHPQPQPLYDSKPVNAIVSLNVVDERGRTIIAEKAALADWVWSGSPHELVSFVYRRGVEQETPLPGGGVNVTPVGEKPDGGWGTYFKPRRNGEYTLNFEVQQPDPSATNFNISLKAVGGGWK